MRLYALSISINYQDHLACVINSRTHFDGWTVVTVPDDAATIQLCAERQLECCIVRESKPGGRGFHAAYNKSRFINAGLRRVREQSRHRRDGRSRSDDWVVVLDADMLLPGDFRERIEKLRSRLDPRMLYGLKGRRVAPTGDEFHALAAMQPWDVYLERHDTVIGYFNLFHLYGPRRFYPVSPGVPSGHDDARFYSKFGLASSARLPFTGLHLGNTAVHWGGRVEEMEPPATTKRSSTDALSGVIAEFGAGSRSQDAVVLGAWLPELVARLAGTFRRVLVVDSRGLATRSRDRLEEADREFVWRRLVGGLAGLENVFLVRKERRARGRTGLPPVEPPEPGSVGLLLVGVEPSYGFLLSEMPRWLRAVRRGGWVCGTHYGQPGFPQTTPGIELLLGTPEHRDEAGGWAMRVMGGTPGRALLRSEAERSACAAEDGEGVVLWVYDGEEARRAVVALHTLRGSWRGALAVVHWGVEVPALRIACARCDAAYVGVVGEARARKDRRIFGERTDEPRAMARGFAMIFSLPYSPFARTLLVGVESGGPEPGRWFAALRQRGPLVMEGDFSYGPDGCVAYVRDHPKMRSWMAAVRRSRRNFAKIAEDEMHGLWREKSRTIPAPKRAPRALADAAAEERLLAATPAQVWWPEDCTVVTAITEEDADPLRQSWRAIRWPAGMRRLVVPFFQNENPRAWLPPGAEACAVERKICAQLPGEPYWNWAIAIAARQARTRRLLYLDPCLHPLPGAQVFWRDPEQAAAYCGNGWAFVRRGARVLKTPKLGPPAALFDVAWLRGALGAFAKRRAGENLETFLHRHAAKTRRAVVVTDVMPCGWNR